MEREDDRDSCACKCLRLPGFCFKPSDEILVSYYLREKVEGRPLCCNHYVAEFKIYDDCLMPWEILKDDDHHWITSSSNDSCNKITKTIYVFTELCKKKTRVIRRSGRGSWTGQNTRVVKNVAGDKIGFKKLLTFYRDNDDKIKKKKKIIDEDHGHWIMHEYSLLGIDDYVLCEIIKEVEMSSQAAVTTKQDFHTHGQHLLSRTEVVLPVPDVIVAADTCADTYLPHVVEILNMVLDDERQLEGGNHDDQPQSGADWDENGWKAELEMELGLNISDDKSSDKLLDDFGEDWDMNGWISELYEQFDGVKNHDRNEILDNTIADVVQELPILAVARMNEPPQVQSVPTFFVEEKDVTVAQELHVAARSKNEKNNESYKGLDGDVIDLSDDDSITDDDLSDFLNYIAEMDGDVAVKESPIAAWGDLEQISNDFANFEQVEATFAVEPTNTTLDELGVMLNSPFYDNLGGAETDQKNCNILQEQPRKRTRTDVNDYQKFSSRKKQMYLQI